MALLKNESLFIAGVNTDRGKTFIAKILAYHFLRQGKTIGYFKPLQTGSPKEGDAIPIASVIGEENCYYGLHLKEPVSPHLALELENKEMPPLKYFVEKKNSLKKRYETLIVEGAGGVLTPLSREKKLTYIDLIKELNLPTILVTTPLLGGINEALLSLEALTRRNIKVAGFIMNSIALKENSLIASDNKQIITDITDIPCLATTPYYKEGVSFKEYYNQVEWLCT